MPGILSLQDDYSAIKYAVGLIGPFSLILDIICSVLPTVQSTSKSYIT